MLSKTASAAIAAASALAEAWDEQGPSLSSKDIAHKRTLSQPLVAKLLTTLSRQGLIEGTPGRHGGYRLAQPPAHITLFDVVRATSCIDRQVMCPFGKRLCGRKPCPLHKRMVTIQQAYNSFLRETTLEVFRPSRTKRSRTSDRQ